ncbi:hypothetical protein H4R34_000648 [Dimargaris verticillata]|uniref:Prolyl endopeptidase n=1 Tax=Dimargaris verticillata TaxID=2761393 RepID=A0A9W8B9Z8_9FUNG|nr:hypothetical protein H4R34_000648 [Dimargaris verticillata]
MTVERDSPLLTQDGVGYPAVRRDEAAVETLHGTPVSDPYRWLEDPDTEETRAFVDAQNQLTHAFIDRYDRRDALASLLTKLLDFEKRSVPSRHGDYYYFFRNTGLQPHSVVYRQTSLAAEPTVFLDPNEFSADKTTALKMLRFSPDGAWFAFTISRQGSDWASVCVGQAAQPDAYSKDEVEWLKFSSLTWTSNNQGFFYQSFPALAAADGSSAGTETNSSTHGKLFYHRIGTAQKDDTLVYYDAAKPFQRYGTGLSDDPEHRYLILTITEQAGSKNKLYVADLSAHGSADFSTLAWTRLVDNYDAGYEFVTCHRTKLYFTSNRDAPRERIVVYDMAHPEAGFTTLVAEHPTDALVDIKPLGQDYLVLQYLHNVMSRAAIHDRATGAPLATLDFPPGTLIDLTSRRQDRELFFKVMSYARPGTIYRYELPQHGLSRITPTTIAPDVFYQSRVAPGIDLSPYESKQVWYKGKDGTDIPMFITCRQGLCLDGSNPTFLYAYGGFAHSMTPAFAVKFLGFVMAFDGIVAIANIRGGGEFGEDWHEQGIKEQKQNVFDDFQEAARWLVAHNYTRPDRLVINGGSNGGLLVGACLNQAPELFGCAIADVGVMDMLRFHKFTIGHAWTCDFGDPDNPHDFGYLYQYSPYHNVQSKRPYPATLLLTGDHDDRVSPLHSYKFIAALQHMASRNPRQTQPLMLAVEVDSGHGAGKPMHKVVEQMVETFSFIALALKLDYRGP